MSCQVIDDFRDGDADGWAPTGGTWQVENPFYGEYGGQDAGTQLSLWSQSMTSGRLGPTVIAQTDSVPQYNGYLVFDYLDASNYKYAGMDDTNGQWVIREVISGTDTLRADSLTSDVFKCKLPLWNHIDWPLGWMHAWQNFRTPIIGPAPSE